MIVVLALLAPTGLLLPVAIQPPEDQAHRLDRMQTRLLNERAADRLRNEKGPTHGEAVTSGRSPEDRALREREEHAIARWQAERGGSGGTVSPPTAATPRR